jgi:hypothetical protein
VLTLAISLVGDGTALGAPAAGKLALDEPLCASEVSVCADPRGPLDGYYVGHDEPSIEFKSNEPGSGNDMTYVMTLPKDPKNPPNASRAGGTTWNFQLRPTFWFGMMLCDTESAPEFTKTCTPDSDKNDLTGTNPRAANYIGKHPGNAFMELQFYPPGYVEQFEGFGCTATQYCAAMTIDSRTLDQNHGDPTTTGTENTTDCDNYILGGGEPTNWAYVTRSGHSQAPANPLFTGTFTNPNFAAVNPDPNKDLFMNPGDRILIHMHDTPAGFQVNLVDLSTGQTGSMTASIANGFGHILFTPKSATCHEAPYAFHPEYSTANTVVTRGASTPTTSRCRTRSDTSRTASRSTRISTAPHPAARTQADWTRTTTTFLRPGDGFDAGRDRRVFQRRPRLGRSVLPS